MYQRLRGRIVEKCGTMQHCAELMGMYVPTFSLKMNGKTPFNLKEIRTLCEILEIPKADVGDYFNIGGSHEVN